MSSNGRFFSLEILESPHKRFNVSSERVTGVMVMLRLVKWVSVFFLAITSTSAFAGIYMGTSTAVETDVQITQDAIVPPMPMAPYTNTYDPINLPCQQYSGKGPMPPHACSAPHQYQLMPQKPLVVRVTEGSLKQNIERIVDNAGWGKPVWKMDYDFKWTGNVTITGRDIQSVLSKLLDPYPLQAKFYESNHIVAIYPRRNT